MCTCLELNIHKLSNIKTQLDFGEKVGGGLKKRKKKQAYCVSCVTKIQETFVINLGKQWSEAECV